MKDKEISIIYIFGPSRLWQDYMSGKPVSWLKIGKTNGNLSDDKWTRAAKRVNQESHTGIPETSRLYEVYSYPFQRGNYDDVFRKILTDDMFSLENSKTNNKLISDPYEIKAGDEFVYNVTRKQIQKARNDYEHGLIISNFKNKESDQLLKDLVLSNQISPFDEVEVIDNMSTQKVNGGKNPDPLMKRLYDSLPESIKSLATLNNGERYHYITIKSKRSNFWYSAAYSTRSRQISVAYETYGGEKSRDEIRSLNIECNAFILEEQQGTKNPEKWSWRVTGSLDQSEDDVIAWFIEKILAVYTLFE